MSSSFPTAHGRSTTTTALDLGLVIDKHRMIIDTSSLMDTAGADWVETDLQKNLEKAARRLAVPKRVYDELTKHVEGADEKKAAAAARGRSLVDHLRARGLADLFGDKDDPFADATIASVVTKYRTRYDMLVVTQDRGLAEHLATIKASPAIRSRRDLLVARVGRNGLERWREAAAASASRPAAAPPRRKASDPLFAPPSGEAARTAGALDVSIVPGDGATVRTVSGVELRLGAALASGGEGVVHKADPGRVAKIYKAGRFGRLTLAKLELMTSRPLAIEGVCWPEDIVLNDRQEPTGYLMRRASGFPLDTSVFKKPLLARKLPDWKRLDLVRLAIRVTEIVQALHAQNVVLGDINPNNILVAPDGAVTFVDLDSAQVENFPCPVGMINFTRAEHHGKAFDTWLRTFEDDRFALAVMLFMILVPGKPPYSHAGGGDPGENIRTRNFPYPFGGQKGAGIPDGPWGFIWSHLSRKVKDTFGAAFRNDVLPDPQEWLRVLRGYEAAIRDGFMDEEQGNEIFPTRRKRVRQEVQERYGFTQDEMVQFSCEACGKTFEWRKSVIKESGRTPQRCNDCQKAWRLDRDAKAARQAQQQEAEAVTASRQQRAAAMQRRQAPQRSPFKPSPRATGGPTAPKRNDSLIYKIVRFFLG